MPQCLGMSDNLNKKKTKVLIQLLTWNGEKFLPFLFKSLKEQTFQDFALVVLDNYSFDSTPKILEKELSSFSCPSLFLKGEKNLGFAQGHNFCFQEGKKHFAFDYVFILNQDVFLAKDYLEKLVNFLTSHQDVAAVQGLLLSWRNQPLKEPEISSDSKIDALGISVNLARQFKELGQGLSWLEFQKEKDSQNPREVFGVTATAALFRGKALEELSEEIFDRDFFSYKEDVDLAYRLRKFGWRAFCLPEALAWHCRTSNVKREVRNPQINYFSYRNHFLLLLKNEDFVNFKKDFWQIFWFELKKFFYLLFFERETLRALKDVFALRKKMFKKRQEIKAKTKIKPEEIRVWFQK